eukprot:scaffold203160_cov17-Tisochrysis_lutea.AAC.3
MRNALPGSCTAHFNEANSSVAILIQVQRLASKGSTGSTPFCDPEDHTLLINIVDCSIGLNGHTVQFPVHFPFHSVQLLTSSQPLIFHRYIHLQGQLSRNT